MKIGKIISINYSQLKVKIKIDTTSHIIISSTALVVLR
jgi:hypothetical protein